MNAETYAKRRMSSYLDATMVGMEDTPMNWHYWKREYDRSARVIDGSADLIEYEKAYSDETPFMVNGSKYIYCWGRYPSGKIDIAVYSYSGDTCHGYKFFRKTKLGIDS